MGKENGAAMAANPSSHRKDRIDWSAPPTVNLVATLERPKMKTKHQVILEFVENKGKKKILESEVVTSRTPPQGFEFVPLGNPALTSACKELSREQGVKIFIVSDVQEPTDNEISLQVNRIGYHVRQDIVEKAREQLGESDIRPVDSLVSSEMAGSRPMTQREINEAADTVIRDLFPRIPNTDRQEIIDRAFRKGATTVKGELTVGNNLTMSLTRRVHLAVLAHIRHHYTRYDQLLKETTWENARKLVQSVCLDVLVKWRGDEENGRDQLDEIIREVVIISDTEDDDEESDEDDSEDEDEDDEEEDEAEETGKTTQGLASTALPHAGEVPRREASVKPKNNKARKPRWSKRERKDRQMADRKAQKRKKRLQGAQRKFSRYQAAWESALSRNRQNHGGDQPQPLTMSRSVSFGPHQHDGHLFRFSQPIPRPGLTSSEQVMVHGGGVPPGYESRPVLGDREEVVVGRVSPKAGYFQQPCPTEHEVAYGRQTHEIPLPSFNAEHRPLKHRLEDTLGRLPEDPYGEHPAPSHRSHAISRLPQGYREEEVVYRSTDLIPPPGRRQSPVYTPYLDDGPSKRRRVVADSPEPVGHSRPYEMVRTVTVDEPLERETMYLSQNRPAYDGFFPPSGRDVYNTEPRVSAPPPFRLDPTRDRMDPGSVHNSLRAAHDHRRTYDRRAVEVSSYESHSYHSRHRVEPRSEEVAGPRHYPQSPLRTPDYAHLTASQSMTDVVEHYRRPPPQYIPHPGSPTHSCMQNERVVYIDGGFSRARSVELASHPPLPSMSDNTRRLERLSVSSDRGVEPPFIVIREHGTHPSPANHAPHYHQSQSDVRPQPSLHSAHAERLAAWSTRPEDRRYDEYARPTAVVINHEEPPSRVWDASGRPQVPRPHGALPQAHMQERGCIYLD